MTYRHYAYQTSEPNDKNRANFITIDSTYEQEPTEYIAKFPITIAEREIIDDGRADMQIIDGELVIKEIPNFDIMLAQNWGNE